MTTRQWSLGPHSSTPFIARTHPDIEIRRVVLEQDLKREYQEFLQDHNRDRSDSDGRPGRDENEVRDWAREHDLPYFEDRVHFPDYRIEYDVDGRELHQDVELFTPHYRGAHAASRARTGFRIYVVASRGGGGRSGPRALLSVGLLPVETSRTDSSRGRFPVSG